MVEIKDIDNERMKREPKIGMKDFFIHGYSVLRSHSLSMKSTQKVILIIYQENLALIIVGITTIRLIEVLPRLPGCLARGFALKGVDFYILRALETPLI